MQCLHWWKTFWKKKTLIFLNLLIHSITLVYPWYVPVKWKKFHYLLNGSCVYIICPISQNYSHYLLNDTRIYDKSLFILKISFYLWNDPRIYNRPFSVKKSLLFYQMILVYMCHLQSKHFLNCENESGI